MRRWLVVGAVVAVGFVAGAAKCGPPVDDWGARVTAMSSTSVHDSLWADSSIVPSIGGPNAPEACHHVPSSVSGRTDYCRVVHGDEQFGDYRDWIVDITLNGGTPVLPGPVSAYNGSQWTITTPAGQMFEDCVQDKTISSPGPGLIMRCDYFVTNQFISEDDPSTGIFMGNVLHELWEWNKYEIGQDENCAGSISLLWATPLTALVSYKLLTDCSDAPWTGP